MSVQRCVGCGIESESHPIVGIGQATDELKAYVLSGTEPSSRGFVAYGVCHACHTDPKHRRRLLKLAFFSQNQMASALAEAGSTTVSQGR